MVYTTLADIENEYRKAIQNASKSKDLTASLFVELSSNLFKELKVKGISQGYDDSDMLLFQYGVYDWGNEFGRHFSFDITRQFIIPTEDEPFQLSFALIFEPEHFEKVGAYETWSIDYSDFDKFIIHVKDTEGFKSAQSFIPKTYSIQFGQC